MSVRSLILPLLAVLWLWPITAYGQSPELRDASNRSKDLSAQGRYQEAIPFAEKALRLSEQEFGPDHPEVATSLNDLGELYRLHGRYAEAGPLHQRALAIRCAETARRIGVERTRPGTTVAKGIEGQVAAAPQGSPGLRVYVDPVTGEFSAPPPWAARPDEALAPQAAYSTSHEGLVETPSPVPGGGVMVDLQGRFRNPMTLMLDADGRTKMQHTSCLDVSGDTQ